MLHWLLVAGVTAWRHVYHNLALFVLPAMMNNGESGCWSQPGVIMYCNENNDEDTTHSAQCYLATKFLEKAPLGTFKK